jgi:hypothetical protein
MTDGNDESLGFEADIRPMFRESDRQAMRMHFDLWAFDDVSLNALPILARLRAGSMPCDGPWPQAQIDLFQRWTEIGMPG